MRKYYTIRIIQFECAISTHNAINNKTMYMINIRHTKHATFGSNNQDRPVIVIQNTNTIADAIRGGFYSAGMIESDNLFEQVFKRV